ncbi:Uncharacterised protein [Corynebacterium imitans]|uniref:Uncharacterized protein n=2 Tax=Corynebacterium imitans TaxID=156978 RepID=A0A239ZHK2_9CORY|nr:hypothetical protein [Corynebacterium imitans]SNV70433.1 Uncharacterised protein [Corynebacterium imitans]
MSRTMMKPRHDRDEYVIWSTVVDLPVSGVMDRGTAKATWAAGAWSAMGTPISMEQAEESMQRADTKGWSLIDGEPGEYEGLNLANIDGYPGDYDFGAFKITDLATITRAIEAGDWGTLHNLCTNLSTVEDTE